MNNGRENCIGSQLTKRNWSPMLEVGSHSGKCHCREGNNAQEALNDARQKFAEMPSLIKVPRKDEGLYVL